MKVSFVSIAEKTGVPASDFYSNFYQLAMKHFVTRGSEYFHTQDVDGELETLESVLTFDSSKCKIKGYIGQSAVDMKLAWDKLLREADQVPRAASAGAAPHQQNPNAHGWKKGEFILGGFVLNKGFVQQFEKELAAINGVTKDEIGKRCWFEDLHHKPCPHGHGKCSKKYHPIAGNAPLMPAQQLQGLKDQHGVREATSKDGDLYQHFRKGRKPFGKKKK